MRTTQLVDSKPDRQLTLLLVDSKPGRQLILPNSDSDYLMTQINILGFLPGRQSCLTGQPNNSATLARALLPNQVNQMLVHFYAFVVGLVIYLLVNLLTIRWGVSVGYS